MSNQDQTHSKVIGYVLWIFGFTGSHRFYFGKPISGTVWFFTGGLLLVGWIIDLFLIPSMNLYEQLWFNVRDRMEEKNYIAGLAYPETRFDSKQRDAEEDQDYAQALLRAAVKFGVDEVLYMAGLTPSRKPTVQVGKSAQEFEALLMDEALTLARHGCANDKSAPAIDRAKTLVAAQQLRGTRSC
jgi:TM2 domain-containing membrane protein YozV